MTGAHLARVPFEPLCCANLPGQKTVSWDLKSVVSTEDALCPKCVATVIAFADDASETAHRFRERMLSAEKAIARARKFLRNNKRPPLNAIADAYRTLDWRQR